MTVSVTPVDVGSAPGDGTGDSARVAFTSVNSNESNFKTAVEALQGRFWSLQNTSTTLALGNRYKANSHPGIIYTMPAVFAASATAESDIWVTNCDDASDITLTPASGDAFFVNNASLGTDTTQALAVGETCFLSIRADNASWDLIIVGSSGGLDAGTAETITAQWDFQGDLKTDSITESTTDAGVTIDGVLLKDNFAYSFGMIRGISTGTMTLAGGNSASLGGKIVLYGETHSSQAGDIEFYDSATKELHFDSSVNLWDFQNNVVRANYFISDGSGSSLVDGATDGFTAISGANTYTVGANFLLYGSTEATTPYDILFRSDTTSELHFDYSANKWDFINNVIETGVAVWASSFRISGTTGLYRDTTNSYLAISGSNGYQIGGNLQMYGSTHSTQANDIEFRENANVVLHYDDSLTRWDFQTNIIEAYTIQLDGSSTHISKTGTTGSLNISGSSTSVTGANINLYGDLHATQAEDIEFRKGTTVVAHFDESANEWDFQAYTINTGGTIIGGAYQFTTTVGTYRNATNSYAIHSGGSSSSAGANLVLYGQLEATTPYDILFRSATTSELHFDYSGNLWDFQANDIVTGGDLIIDVAGSGIDFSAVANSAATGATTDTETLAAFQQGTWDPTIRDSTDSDSEGQTYSIQEGWWVRIGDTVFFNGSLTITSLGTLTTSDTGRIGGLPFSSINSTNFLAPCSIAGTGFSITADTSVFGRVGPNSDYITTLKYGAATGLQSMPLSEVSTAAMSFSGHYRI